ncbi:MAG: hypothetical protein MZV65_40780 [Chromatiales bacterium]|nr:hypothetical protein [Chromatiales bacterium]
MPYTTPCEATVQARRSRAAAGMGEPGHPDADAKGFVAYPDVNPGIGDGGADDRHPRLRGQRAGHEHGPRPWRSSRARHRRRPLMIDPVTLTRRHPPRRRVRSPPVAHSRRPKRALVDWLQRQVGATNAGNHPRR